MEVASIGTGAKEKPVPGRPAAWRSLVRDYRQEGFLFYDSGGWKLGRFYSNNKQSYK